ncbi:hypothetical protein Fmac_023164 [Flemingia macrophylla]|uniref:Uncharacterized protein n=1 Tax=Flemingia macrophylla TaxID=520843 RepID=A0ABD1LKT9_9FABA
MACQISCALIRPKQFKNRAHRGSLYLYCCLGNFKVQANHEDCHLSPSLVADEDESVDEKAERFIQNFYHQIRMQTHHSL